MSTVFKQAIASIKNLSTDEKALMAHCLISSLDRKQDDDVDSAWAVVAERRFLELKSGAVAGKSWAELKAEIIS